MRGAGDDNACVSTQLHDFQAPSPLPGNARALARALEEAAPRIGLALGASSRREFVVRCAGVDRVQSRVLTRGAVLAVPLDLGLGEPGLLVVPEPLVVALADLAMGGEGRPADRAPSRLEERLARRHLGSALVVLAPPLRPHGIDGVRLLDSEHDALGADMVALHLMVSVVDGFADQPFVVALPASLIRSTTPTPARTLVGFGDVAVEVSLRLPATTLSAAEVDELHLGDVIRLEQRTDSPVIGTLDGTPVLLAQLGRRGAVRAVVVHQVLEEM